MVENNVKENLIDDEEELYVNLNDLVNLRESAELREAANAFESYLVNYAQVATWRIMRWQQECRRASCRISAICLYRQHTGEWNFAS